MPDTQDDPPPPTASKDPVAFDHPIYHRAPAISIGAGIVAALVIAFLTNAPWWMPLLAFAVVASVLFRILRPQMRSPSIEDEI